MGSLLDFAQDNGITVNSGCRAGGCGSCQTTIRSGEVAYTQSPDCDPEAGQLPAVRLHAQDRVTLEA
jgi:ferredoxin